MATNRATPKPSTARAKGSPKLKPVSTANGPLSMGCLYQPPRRTCCPPRPINHRRLGSDRTREGALRGYGRPSEGHESASEYSGSYSADRGSRTAAERSGTRWFGDMEVESTADRTRRVR